MIELYIYYGTNDIFSGRKYRRNMLNIVQSRVGIAKFKENKYYSI